MAGNKIRLSDIMLRALLAVQCRAARLSPAMAALSFGHVAYWQRSGQPSHCLERIVMLHGAASDKSVWLALAKHLRVSLPVLIPDLPGHGDSIVSNNLRYDIQSQAMRVREFVLSLGDGRLHLIANSMGAAIALRLSADFPELVASLVLIDAAGVESLPSWLRQELSRTGINPMLEVNSLADYRAMLHIGMAKPPYLPGIFLSSLARSFVGRRKLNLKIADDIETNLDQTAILSKIAAPSLIIWGREDKVVHVGDADFLHEQLSNSRKIILDGIGHVPMVEAPQLLAAACDAFFSEIG